MKYSATTNGFHYDDDPNLPEDAVEVTEQERVALLNAQSTDRVISPGATGYPVAVEHPPASTYELIKRQILLLETQQTPRRMREALLGTDNGWLAGIESQIEILRAQLVNL